MCFLHPLIVCIHKLRFRTGDITAMSIINILQNLFKFPYPVLHSENNDTNPYRIFRTMVNLTISGAIMHDELQDVAQLKNPLRKLSIKDVIFGDDASPDIPPHLYNLISKHAQTLELLTVRFLAWEFYDDLKLPALLNLKRFDLTVPSVRYGWNFYIDFPPETPNLAMAFPRLREFCLTFHVVWEGYWTNALESLFSSETQVCPNVRKVEIRDLNWRKTYCFVDRGYEIDVKYARIFKIFPNANNKFVQDLRKYFEKKGMLTI